MGPLAKLDVWPNAVNMTTSEKPVDDSHNHILHVGTTKSLSYCYHSTLLVLGDQYSVIVYFQLATKY